MAFHHNRTPLLVASLVLVVEGCSIVSPTPSMEELQEACSFSATNENDLLLTGDGQLEVSEECAESLGLLVGFDWSSFGEDPHRFTRPTTSAESIIGGIYLLIGASNVPVEDWFSEEAPDSLSALAHTDPGDMGSTSQFWYNVLKYSITEVKHDLDLKSLAFYSGGSLSIGVIDSSEETGLIITPSKDSISFIESSVLMAHESAHDVYPGHLTCPETQERNCDDNRDGAYGVGAWWGYHFMLNNYVSMEFSVCLDGAEAVYKLSCDAILNDAEWPPCAGETLYDKCIEAQQ